MCTLSWLPAPNGFRVFFNRDERLTRRPERPPAVESIAGVRVITPADGDFGGTWIGVNELGLAACLLNRYEDGPGDPPRNRISRGLLLRSLLSEPDPGALLRALTDAALHRYQPFTIAAFGPDRGPVLVDWTGHHLRRGQARAPGLLRTSSGHDQRAAERVRGRTFAALVRPLRAADLRAVHRSHRPERGATSVCMHRPDAATQSYTEIRVTGSSVTLRYTDGPPCTPRRRFQHRLPRGTPAP